MYHNPRSIMQFILLLLASVVLAVPDLGISLDPLPPNAPKDSYHSYSGAILFNDISIPGDSTKMSDAQFINLAKVAYNEMVAIWRSKLWTLEALPGAMVALESEGKIYFASSIRALPGMQVAFASVDKDIQYSIGWFLDQCAQGMGLHRRRGRCAEPNVLRLYGDYNGVTDDNPPQYKKPTTPRIAVWGRAGDDAPVDEKEEYLKPCQDSGNDYGCIRLTNFYGWKPVPKGEPDETGQDDWKFTILANPRHCS
jgi:hypothetical protein